jgi:hypothetical protein
LVEDDDPDGTAEAPKGLFVQLGPPPGAGLEGQESDALTAVAEGEDEQARAAVLAGDGMPHHRALAVVDLAFFAGRGDDDRVRVRRALAAELAHEAAHTGVAAGELMLIDEVLPDGHGVAAAAERQLDQLAIRFAGAGGRCPAAPRRPRRERARARRDRAGVGGHLAGRRWRVGGHLYGRFWVSTEAPVHA